MTDPVAGPPATPAAAAAELAAPPGSAVPAALAVVGGLLATAALVVLLGAGAGDSVRVGSRAWLVWRAVAAAAVVATWTSGWLGARQLLALRTDGERGLPPRFRNALLAAAALVAVVVGLYAAGLTTRDWGIPWMGARLTVVTGLCAASAVPWLALTWLQQRALTAPGVVPLPALLAAWDRLLACVTGFGVLVVAALVSAGVLRVLWLSGDPAPAPESFPSTDVLLFGGAFAAVLSGVAVPLVASWRRQARLLVDDAHPVTTAAAYTAQLEADRGRLEELLHLDVPLLRSPVTALTVFTPLVTSALAAFVPELG